MENENQYIIDIGIVIPILFLVIIGLFIYFIIKAIRSHLTYQKTIHKELQDIKKELQHLKDFLKNKF